MNVNGYIVKFNFNRFVGGQTDKFDAMYLSSMYGSDAVPELVTALRTLWPAPAMNGVNVKAQLYTALDKQQKTLQEMIKSDWRNAVVSDYRALASLGELQSIDPATLVQEKFIGNYNPGQWWNGEELILPKEITGNLDMRAEAFAAAKTYPARVFGDVTIDANSGTLNVPVDEIGGSLIMRNGSIKMFGTMPGRIGKDLDLSVVEVDSLIPAGLKIGGAIKVSNFFGNVDNFIKDAQSKGYTVIDISAPMPLGNFAPGPCGGEENPCPIQPTSTR
jgi:hypothetical protein